MIDFREAKLDLTINAFEALKIKRETLFKNIENFI